MKVKKKIKSMVNLRKRKQNKKENFSFLDNCEFVLNYLLHYNHYERLNHLIIEQKSLESTYNRYKRGQEFGEIFTVNDAKCFLGDQENSSFPIFRILNDTDKNTVTLCTVHIDFNSLELIIYEDNPKILNQPSFIYNLVDLLT